MNLKTWAEENSMSLKEAKEATGLTHWNQKVEEEEWVAKEATEKKPETSQEDVELIELSCRTMGTKSPYWEKRNLVGRK